MDKFAFIRACRDGGAAIEEALRALDRSFFPSLYRECLRVVRDADAAYDLVQETLIKIWRRCHTFRGESELLPWIRVILRRGVLDRARRAGNEIAVESDVLEELLDGSARDVSSDAASPPEADVRRAEQKACFERCWRRFQAAAPAHAAVLSWIVDDGLSHAEIAKLLDRSPGATREFISQCRKRARVHFAEWHALTFSTEMPR
jgi:RNA polymerase sigma-70 factor (ECF subfamily)